MRSLKVVVVVGLVVMLIGWVAVPTFAVAQAEYNAKAALTWTYVFVKTSTGNPSGQCEDSDLGILTSVGMHTCQSGGNPEFAFATATAELGWHVRGRVEVRGSQASAKVDVRGPDPATLPSTLSAGSTFSILVQAADVKGNVMAVVTLFKAPQPQNKAQAAAPSTVLASQTLDLTKISQVINLTLRESANKNEIGIQLAGAASSTSVPTLTQWGLIALGLLLAGSLAVMIRRRFSPRPAGA